MTAEGKMNDARGVPPKEPGRIGDDGATMLAGRLAEAAALDIMSVPAGRLDASGRGTGRY